MTAPSETDAPMFALSGVGKAFSNGIVALAALDLEVRRGEFLTLLGPSGCGKSTALRMIAGLTEPSAGALTWAGGERPEIGFVFQEPTLMPWASVFNNVWLPLRLRGISKAAAAASITDALALVGLADFAKAYPRELSGGMKMRVSIARALVLRPPLLLMDEPFAALDEITRFKLNDDLLRLKSELGATVVFVTHSVYESVYLSTRIAVMAARPGRIVSQILIEAPLPRGEEFRTTALYNERCRAASQALMEALSPEDRL
ncbi:MAG: ABC transporter ATP-binding protein [Methylobacteriaceae bacterium]|nr:ABC transporter ATP-binding protein [Methylobacteriaceae bacterium]MBV9247549.1 ABC transporter ATP-binding protein [Methylobacteriaceae bacterium]MBV9702760.1 ABC transporter ATP-binding protein [Methylobacteriaceae bacterium]